MKVRLRLQITDDEGNPLGEIDAEGIWSGTEPSARILRPEFRQGNPPGDSDDVIHDTENPGPTRSQAV